MVSIVSSIIWTPAELKSEFVGFDKRVWRVVEAQNRVSTMKVVRHASQAELETILNESKPPLPESCERLHYLLYTPFRYDAPYPKGSRFRRAGRTDGVFYASCDLWTAVAETVFYRLLFYAESPGIPFPVNPEEYSAFDVRVMSENTLPLSADRFKASTADWLEFSDYTRCQAMADVARAAGADIIKYGSVRDSEHGSNIALLNPAAFLDKKPSAPITLKLHFNKESVRAVREFPYEYRDYPIFSFAADPRIAPLLNR
jgi:hypothetical protein